MTHTPNDQNLLIWAEDARFLDDASREWAARWGGGDGAVNLAAIGLEPAKFAMELNTLPMWSERQVFRLRQAESATEDLVAALGRYLENPSPSTALLVEFVGDLSPKNKSVPARWRSILEKIRVSSLAPRSGKEYIVKRLKSEDFSIESEAVSSLDAWACGEVGRLVSALDLLCLYKAHEKRITANDLDALLGTGGTPKEWDLQDAFLRGDRKSFLDLLGKIAQDPESVPLMFVGMISKQLRALLLLHGYEARGVPRKEIPPKDLGFNHPYPAQKLVGVAGKWSEARVRATLGALFELDLALKGDPGPPWVLVERHLLKVIGK